MKIRPLPEIDLACIAPLPTEQKRAALEQLRLAYPPYSYAPVRACLSDILNIHAGLVGALPRPPWAKVQDAICKRSKKTAEEVANLRVGEGLFNYVEERRLSGRHHEIFPLSLGVTTKVSYWHPVVLSVEGRPLVPFFDPRRAKALTSRGRQFVFSVMHEHIRLADPDFAEVGLGIFQFALCDKGPREPILHPDAGVPLFSFDQLDDMVRETYAIWEEVCVERAAEARRKAGGMGGGFV